MPAICCNCVDDSDAKNPSLKVRVEAGYYDMACVFAGAVINFWHLGYDKTFTDRVSFSWFEGGHMMYTRPSAHKAHSRTSTQQ